MYCEIQNGSALSQVVKVFVSSKFEVSILSRRQFIKIISSRTPREEPQRNRNNENNLYHNNNDRDGESCDV